MADLQTRNGFPNDEVVGSNPIGDAILNVPMVKLDITHRYGR